MKSNELRDIVCQFAYADDEQPNSRDRIRLEFTMLAESLDLKLVAFGDVEGMSRSLNGQARLLGEMRGGEEASEAWQTDTITRIFTKCDNDEIIDK